MRGLSRKLYLDLSVPTEEDQRSDQQRILEALSAEGVKEEVHIPVRMLRQLYPLLDRAGWKITVSLSWNGEKWELVDRKRRYSQTALWAGCGSWKYNGSGETFRL